MARTTTIGVLGPVILLLLLGGMGVSTLGCSKSSEGSEDEEGAKKEEGAKGTEGQEEEGDDGVADRHGQ